MAGKDAATQLEIAAHWLEESSRQFAALKQFDFSENCKRVAMSCLSAAKREEAKC